MSDNNITSKVPTAGIYKFDNGKVSLTAKAADGCQECFNLAQELLKEKEAYEKLKVQLDKAEAALLLISAPHCDYRTFESETLERLIECIVADTDCAREYFKEKGKV